MRIAMRRYEHQQREDLLQEAIARAIETGTAVRHPRAFLGRVVRNVAVDEARRMAVRGGAAIQIESMPDHQAPYICADQEVMLTLKQIVLGLPERYRDVFVLSRFQGFSYEEVAAELGLTVKAVEYRMSRALALCAKALGD